MPVFERDAVRWRRYGDVCAAEFAPAPKPDLLTLARRDPRRYPFLLESSAGAAAQSRYDILLAFPGAAIEIDGADCGHDFFARLDTAAERERCAATPGLIYPGGWFVYLAYEMAQRVEPTLDQPRPRDDKLPDALAVRCPAALIFDRHRGRLQIVAEAGDRACVDAMLDDLIDAQGDWVDPAPLVATWREAPGEDYRRQVEAARSLIHAGDVFQVNLARAWHGRLAAAHPPATVYAALRAANPAPFSGLIQWRDAALACSSPERLLRIDNGIAQTRPIAGTRARARGTDAEATVELLAHPKERAEHVMLIDLERNDLGRIAAPGTIRVDELMRTESYAHVHHIVSNVRARLRPDVGPGRALRAVFPGGTITGCPKVRCMQIIAALEGTGRGAYTGGFGYLGRSGRLDTNIVIRSLSQCGDALTLRTGAGIVADSDPDKELEETRAKARGVLRGFVDDNGRVHG